MISVAEDKIGPEGLQALFDTLEVDPLDIVSLVFAWKLMAKVPFEFSRTEFVNGCIALAVDSLEKLKAVLRMYLSTSMLASRPGTHPGNTSYLHSNQLFPLCVLPMSPTVRCDAWIIVLATLKKSLDNESAFRNFYMFAFDYNKPPEQRSLPIETARQLFPLILEGRFAHLDLWNEFLQDRKHAISKDTYSLLLDFTKTIDQNFNNFDEENGAWPVLLDEFVDFAKPRIVANKDKMDD